MKRSRRGKEGREVPFSRNGTLQFTDVGPSLVGVSYFWCSDTVEDFFTFSSIEKEDAHL